VCVRFSRTTLILGQLFGLDRAAAMNSGSEAIDLAVKIARKWAYQVKKVPNPSAYIVTATSNYHGRTMTSLSASDSERLREDCGPFLPNVGTSVKGSPPVRYGNIEDLERVLQTYSQETAAVMLESIQGSAGCVVPPAGYLKQVRELCTKFNVLLILDEVQSGFGRTGHLAAYQADCIKPDLLILGKSLTGGAYSMGMVVGIDRAMQTYKAGQ
jgi:ornithine--oxo-acid transaminase